MSFPIYAGARLISVAGLAECIVSCSGNDSLPNESGLVSTTAALVLRDPDGDRGRFDPVRHPSQFARGRVIRIGDHCRGYLRIANDQYVPATGELNLELADILTILNWKEPPDQLEYPKPGEPKSKFWIINYLLGLAEAPALIDNIPGELECPLQRNSSLIALCGEIAASEGYYLWVDEFENVRASEIMPRSSGFSIGSGLWTIDNSINLERVRASETPVELVRVHSNGCKPKPVEPIKEYIEEIWGAFIFVEGNTENPEEEMTQLFKVDSVLLLRRSVRDEFNIVERMRSVHTLTEEVFYSSSAMFADPDNFDTNVRAELLLTSELFEDYFYSSEDGSLIQKIATEYKPFFSFDSAGVATAGDPILWRKVTTTYEYIDEYTKRIEEIEERSVVQDGITNTELITYRTQYQEWEELRAEQWRWINRVMQALGSLNPNVPNAAKYTLVFANDESFVKVGNGGETQPPAIERHPALFEIEEFPISGKAEFSPVAGAQYRVRSHDYTMNFIENEATCDRVAAALGQLRWGRWFGCKVEAPFKNARNYRPGMRFSMQDPSAKFSCIAEGFTWAFDAKSAVASWNGVSLSMPGGTSTNIDLTVNTGPSQTFLPQGATLIEFGTPIPHDLPPGSSIVIGGIEIIVSQFAPKGATQVNIFPSPAPIANGATASYTVTDELPLYLNVKSFNAGWGALATFELLPYPLLKPAIDAIGAIGFGTSVTAPQPVITSAGWGLGATVDATVVGVTRIITITSTTAYTNYPLLLTNLNTSEALASGADIRFFDSDGVTPLTYYLEPYSTSATRDIVVRVPSIPSGGSKEIFMKYGQGQNAPQSTPSAIAPSMSSANLQLWIDARDLGLANLSPIETFIDRKANTVTQPTLTRRASYQSSSVLGIAASFDGTDDLYDFTMQGTSDFTIFESCKWNNTTGFPVAFSYARGAATGPFGRISWGYGCFEGRFSVFPLGDTTSQGSVVADTNKHIFRLQKSASIATLHVDGVLSHTLNYTNANYVPGNANTLSSDNQNGNYGNTSSRLSGQLIIIGASISAQEANQINWYLNQKATIGSNPSYSITSGVTYIERAITITSTATHSEYPVYFEFDGTKSQLNESDIRVLDSDRATPLTFYLEPNPTLSTRGITVRVPNIPNGSKTIYIRYQTGETTSLSTRSAINAVLSSANCTLWLDANDLTEAHNAPISAWSDRSPANTAISQATLSRRPLRHTNVVNNKSAILFDGVDDRLEGTLGSVDFTILSVCRPTNLALSAEPGVYLYGRNATVGIGLGIRNYQFWQGAVWGNRWLTASTVTANTTTWRAISLSRSGSNVSLKIDNTQTGTGTASEVLGTLFYLGTNHSSGFYAGYIQSFIVCNIALTAAQESAIAQYLMQRVGIGNHPTVSVGVEV